MAKTRMKKPENKKFRQILRIRKYERLLDEARLLLRTDPFSPRLSRIAIALERYYVSPRWMADFQADEAGKLPFDLKRGVLSEDAVDSFLSDYASSRSSGASDFSSEN